MSGPRRLGHLDAAIGTGRAVIVIGVLIAFSFVGLAAAMRLTDRRCPPESLCEGGALFTFVALFMGIPFGALVSLAGWLTIAFAKRAKRTAVLARARDE